MRTIKRFVWVALGLLVLETAHAASFDCAKAATRVEKLICGNSELSRLDEKLSEAYKAALKDAKHAEAVRQSQRLWLTSRLSVCYDAGCIKEAYEQRLAWLEFPIVTDRVGKLINARDAYSATLMSNGQVLIAGGEDGAAEIRPGDTLDRAELYDPATRRLTATGNLVAAREGHEATLLPNGKVLVYGGGVLEGDTRMNEHHDVELVELYDPASGKFSKAHDLPPAHIAITPLRDGKILAMASNAADLYDPATGRITPVSLTRNVFNLHEYTATLLQNGKVLVMSPSYAELYDPEKNALAETGKPLLHERKGYTATLLENGKVLVVGGYNNFDASGHSVEYLRSAELYDPATGRFSPTGELVTPRTGHSAILLPNGKVLVVGGEGPGQAAGGVRRILASVELYDPATGRFSFVGNLDCPDYRWTFTLLKNGTVLIIDGDSAEIYDPAANNK